MVDEQRGPDKPAQGIDDSIDEQATGPASPDDPFPQPVQEIVDPRDPDSSEVRERIAISGVDQPPDEPAG